MSQENLEVVRRALAVNRSGPPGETVEQVVALAAPTVRFRSRLTSVEGAAYKGHEGARRYYDDLSDAWREWRNEVDEIAEIRPDTVLANTRFLATGHSGVTVELRSFTLWVLSDGKVLELTAFSSERDALEAAGLSE
jgi:hypothetical protein